MERGGLATFAEVEAALFRGELVLWIAAEGSELCAAALTRIRDAEGNTKVCEIVAVGGVGLSRWRTMLLTKIEDYARTFGCNRVFFVGRKGWARIMDGYTIKKVVMERRL